MADSKKPEAKTSKKNIIDVSHPGKTPPSPNSKSVIVTNRSILKDPMMLGDKADDEETNKATEPAFIQSDKDTKPSETAESADKSADKPADKIVDKSSDKEPADKPTDDKMSAPLDLPLPDSVKVDTKAKTEESEDTKPTDIKPEKSKETEPAEDATFEKSSVSSESAKDNPKFDDPNPDKPIDPVPEPTEDAKSSQESSKSKPESDDVDDEGSAKTDDKDVPAPTLPSTPESAPESAPEEQQSDDGKKKGVGQSDVEAAAEEEAAAKRQASIGKLVEAKTYFLPINAVEKRRSKRFIVVGILLSILLILAWADLALDAGLVTISGVNPVTHLFSN